MFDRRLLHVCAAAIVASTGAWAQITTLVSVSPSGEPANATSTISPYHRCSISADGRFVAFESHATNLVEGDFNGYEDVFVHDRQRATTELVSVNSAGEHGIYGSVSPQISADGRYVAFTSDSSNLVAGDSNNTFDIFIRDRQSGTTELVSQNSSGVQANGSSRWCGVSADGRFVAFKSNAQNLVPGDTNAAADIFVRDRQNGTTERVSVGVGGAQSNQDSDFPGISDDGRCVVFFSYATNLVAGPTVTVGIYVHDRQTGITEKASVNNAGVEADSGCIYPTISGNGRFVAFPCTAGNMGPQGAPGIYVRDRQNGTTELASLTWTGAPAGLIGESSVCAISADGRHVAFWTQAAAAPGESTLFTDVFVRDRQLGTTQRVSVNTNGVQANADSIYPAISADGNTVAFMSSATNLATGSTSSGFRCYVREGGTPLIGFCFADDWPQAVTTLCPCGPFPPYAGHGCSNSVYIGALLTASGSTNPDTIDFHLYSIPAGVASIFLQGDQSIPTGVVFGDGVRCVGGNLRRLGLTSDTHFDSSTEFGPSYGDPQVSVAGAVVSGNTYYYQAYYRNPDPSWCPPATFNISGGVVIPWP